MTRDLVAFRRRIRTRRDELLAISRRLGPAPEIEAEKRRFAAQVLTELLKRP